MVMNFKMSTANVIVLQEETEKLQMEYVNDDNDNNSMMQMEWMLLQYVTYEYIFIIYAYQN